MEKRHHNHCGHRYADKDAHHSQPQNLTQLMNECERFLSHRIGGTRGRDTVLKLLASQPEMSQKELQTQLGIQAGSVSELLSKLEHREFLTRRKDDKDKRVIQITLTEKGRQEAALLECDRKEDPFSVLEPEEQEALQQLLEKLLGAWAERYGKGHHRHAHQKEA